jgi:succinylarginine dihydrolase
MYRFWTIVKIFLGKCQVFQASQPEEAAHGEEEQAAHQRRPTVHFGHPKVFLSGREQQARPLGGRLTARQAVARRNNEILKGGAYDE